MRRALGVLGGGALALAVGLAWAVPRLTAPPDIPIVRETALAHFTLHEQDVAGLCPWRNRDADLKRFFPTATGTAESTLILSRQMLEVARRLGRSATGDDNALKVYRVLQGSSPLGVIVTRRIRGESGLIELALAVGTDGKVRGADIQRLREPDAVAQALHSPAWLDSFKGRTADSDWRNLGSFPPLPPAAQPSAAAIIEGARTALILLDIAQSAPHAAAAH